MVSHASLPLLQWTMSVHDPVPSADIVGAFFPGGISPGCLVEDGLVQLGGDIFAGHITPTLPGIKDHKSEISLLSGIGM